MTLDPDLHLQGYLAVAYFMDYIKLWHKYNPCVIYHFQVNGSMVMVTWFIQIFVVTDLQFLVDIILHLFCYWKTLAHDICKSF